MYNEKCVLVKGSLNILVRCRKHFYQFWNAHGYEVRHTEICTVESLVPDPNTFVFEIAVERQKAQITRY